MTPRRQQLLALAILAAVPTILFVDVIAGSGVFYIRDIAQLHFPTKKVLRDIVLAGEFPYWNPLLGAGQPLAANPTYGVFYPPTWLVLPDLIYGLQWLALIHVYIATFGMYRFLRSLGCGRAASGIGAISLGIGGYVMSSLNLFPMLFGIAWLPLTCLFTRRFLHRRRPRDFAGAAVSLGLICLVGEPVTVLQSGILLGLYALFRRERHVLRDLGTVGAISIAALLVSAAQMLPTIDHAGDSVRAVGLTYEQVTSWSTAPERLFELVYPDLLGSVRRDAAEPFWGARLYPGRGGGFLLSIYPGLLMFVLAVAGLAVRARGWPLFATTTAVSIVLALGQHTPLLRVLHDAGVRWIRFPEKFLMLALFALVAFGSVVLDRLIRGDARLRRIAAIVAAATAAGAVFGFFATPALFAEVWRRIPNAQTLAYAQNGWLIAVVRGVVLATLFASFARLRPGIALAAVGAFVLADLAPRTSEIAPRIAPAFYTDVPPMTRQLAPDRHAYRIFPLAQWTGRTAQRLEYQRRGPQLFVIQRGADIGFVRAAYGLRTAIDIDFDQTFLRVTDEFSTSAWALQPLRPDWLTPVTAMANVRYVALPRPFADELARTRGDARLMEPLRFVGGGQAPRYYFATQVVTIRDRHEFVRRLARERFDRTVAFIHEPAFQPARGVVRRWSETANSARIEVEAEGPAFLVMSVTPHDYWIVTIGGVEVPAVRTNLGFQGVPVPRGRHVVEMRYRNPLVPAGAAISLAAILALAFVAFRARRDITMRDL